jgi:hypothetical protein
MAKNPTHLYQIHENVYLYRKWRVVPATINRIVFSPIYVNGQPLSDALHCFYDIVCEGEYVRDVAESFLFRCKRECTEDAFKKSAKRFFDKNGYKVSDLTFEFSEKENSNIPTKPVQQKPYDIGLYKTRSETINVFRDDPINYEEEYANANNILLSIDLHKGFRTHLTPPLFSIF